jgi:hypothetical protein
MTCRSFALAIAIAAIAMARADAQGYSTLAPRPLGMSQQPIIPGRFMVPAFPSHLLPPQMDDCVIINGRSPFAEAKRQYDELIKLRELIIGATPSVPPPLPHWDNCVVFPDGTSAHTARNRYDDMIQARILVEGLLQRFVSPNPNPIRPYSLMLPARVASTGR